MKIGYACINQSLECRSSRTFRLRNYSNKKLEQTVKGNLDCLMNILRYNKEHELYIFRITSDLIPFASHDIMDFDWQNHFKSKFIEIGNYIKENDIRITMHPGQYTVLNSKNNQVFENSLKELYYHVEVLDLMGLYKSAKVQIHVGGVYNDKKNSIKRFIKRYNELNENILERLIIENDDKSYSLEDCLFINRETQVPIVFDVYHHECLNNGETLLDAFEKFTKTWNKRDGIPLVHYSSDHSTKIKGKHAESINLEHFNKFIDKTKKFNFDIMLEIKDKEKSALLAVEQIHNDIRFNKNN